MKKKKWWQYLLRIPAVFLIDIAVLVLAGIADTYLFSGSENTGHGAPAIIIIAFVVMVVVTAVVIIKTIVDIFRKEKTTETKEVTVKKGSGRILLVIPAQIIISLIILFFTFRAEVNSFYASPEHVGFPVPIVSFVLAFILMIVTVLTVIIVLLINGKRNK